MGVAASENSSAAYDNKGDIYVWGAMIKSESDLNIHKIHTHKTIGKIEALDMTESFFIVLTKKH